MPVGHSASSLPGRERYIPFDCKAVYKSFFVQTVVGFIAFTSGHIIETNALQFVLTGVFHVLLGALWFGF